MIKHHVNTLLEKVHSAHYTHEDVLMSLTSIHHQLDGAESIVCLSKPALIRSEPWGIQDIIRRLINSYSDLPHEIEFTNRLASGGPVSMLHSEDEIKQILQSGIQNAVESMEHVDDAFLYIKCYLEDNHCIIEIHDNGSGLPEHIDSGQLMLPYVSTKGNTEKNPHEGLGLYLCKKTVTEKGGTLILKPSPCGGALFQVGLPCATEQAFALNA